MHNKVKITNFWNNVIIIVLKKFLSIYIIYSSLLILISLIMKKLIYTKVDHLYDIAHIKRKIFCRKIKNNTCPFRSNIDERDIPLSIELFRILYDIFILIIQRLIHINLEKNTLHNSAFVFNN